MTFFVSPVPMAPRHPSLVKDHKSPEMIAMVHVHSTTAILNHGYTALLKVAPPTRADTQALNAAIAALSAEARALKDAYPILSQVAPTNTMLRSAVFLLGANNKSSSGNIIEDIVVKQLGALPFIKALVDRAVAEVDIYVRHGIRCVEVENVAAPYFIGAGNCPWEELILIYLSTRAIREKYPSLMIGMHILSANELEVLPLAIACGAYFVRSEATLFHGIRPEGETQNHSNMARYLYVRQVLRNLIEVPSSTSAAASLATELHQSQFPQIWSDVKKKHTVFFDELKNIDDWLHNINFMKLEGVIVTGAETGSDVDEDSLKRARKAVEGFKAFNEKQFAAVAEQLKDAHANGSASSSSSSTSDATSNKDYFLPHLPVVTGSGMNFPMYRNYADYCIVGTALKHGSYWENEVSEENVARVVAEFKAFAGSS